MNPSSRAGISRREFVAASGAMVAAAVWADPIWITDASQPQTLDDAVAFFVISDTHYLADIDDPSRLADASAACTVRMIDRLNTLVGTEIPIRCGGGVVHTDNASTPHDGQQSFFYVELSPHGLTIREYSTTDAWKTAAWSPLVWRRPGAAVTAS